jgi:hypothetical protein
VAANAGLYNRFVPKRPRQAHVPQQTRKRKVRKQQPQPLRAEEQQNEQKAPAPRAETSSAVATAERPQPRPVEPATGSRLAARRANAESMRARQGQLPLLDRAYVMAEMRRSGIVSGVLFFLIVVLWVLLR